MKCPKCVEEGKKSVLYIGETWATAKELTRYFDEWENYHYHDENIYKTSYFCSDGHHFVREHKKICPGCDFNEDAGGCLSLNRTEIYRDIHESFELTNKED